MTPLCSEHSSTPYHLDGDGFDRLLRSDISTVVARLRGFIWSSQGKELIGSVSLGLIIYFSGYAFLTPHQRPMPYQYLESSGEYVRNLMHNETGGNDTVADWQLGVLCVLICPMLQLVFAVAYGVVGDVHKTICLYWMVIPVNEAVTWGVKVFVGYLRPVFYSLCQPSDNYEYCTQGESTGNLRMSFPSGHASWAFAALTLLHLYLEQCLGVSSVSNFVTKKETTIRHGSAQRIVLQQPENVVRYRFASVLCLIPMALATFIAVSRVADNKHFPADVVAGSALGFGVARYFHNVW
jgi:membrane-associated phospholipid phosphatase